MFSGMKKKSSSASSSGEVETIIGSNFCFKGAITGKGNIRVDGMVEGEIAIDGDVIVGEKGCVTAGIGAKNVLIAGTVNGNMAMSGKLEILRTGKLYGDVRAVLLSIDEGAVFKGNSVMEPVEAITNTASDNV